MSPIYLNLRDEFIRCDQGIYIQTYTWSSWYSPLTIISTIRCLHKWSLWCIYIWPLELYIHSLTSVYELMNSISTLIRVYICLLWGSCYKLHLRLFTILSVQQINITTRWFIGTVNNFLPTMTWVLICQFSFCGFWWVVSFLDYTCAGCMFLEVVDCIRKDVFYMLKPFYVSWCIVLHVGWRIIYLNDLMKFMIIYYIETLARDFLFIIVWYSWSY